MTDHASDMGDAMAIVSAMQLFGSYDAVPQSCVLLLVDSQCAVLWQETVSDAIAGLIRIPQFEEITHWELSTGGADPNDVEVRFPAGGASVDQTTQGATIAQQRHIVLVLTDGVAPAWHSGAALARIHTLARQLPLVLVQLLPQRLWYRTGLCPERATLRAPAPGVANAGLTWQVSGFGAGLEVVGAEESADVIAIPVLRPHWLSAWSSFVAGAPDGIGLPIVLAHAGQYSMDREAEESPPVDPTSDAREQVRRFTSWATPTAVSLATRLAAAPLNLPMIYKLQRELLPSSDASHVAEVVHSGLMHAVGAQSVRPSEHNRVTLEFHDGVRAELLAAGRRADTVRVLHIVDEYLGETVPSVTGLSRVLEDPDNGPERAVTSETEPFVRVEQAALQALSGRYLRRSRWLQALLSAERPLSPSDVTSDGLLHELDSLPQAPAFQTRPGGTGVTSRTAPEISSAAELFPAPPAPAGLPAVWGKVPPRNINFTGRAQLLAQLESRMEAGTTAVLPQALHGMGGVGKSQLAVEYVYRHQANYDVIWWIPAERVPQAKTALVDLGRRLGLPISRQVNAALPVVLEALRLGQPYANWLLVFDNAESPEALRECMPASGTGRILVTSRDPRWGSVAATLEVDVFKRQESLQLLQRRRPEITAKAADRLAAALGDLPLAIEQAAAWLAETGMPAEEYLRLFEEKRAELLHVSAPPDYQLPVAAAWNVSLDRLNARSPAALRLLQVCSFLASEPIPRTLLGRAHSTDIHPDLNETIGDPMRLNRAIREINRYALAKINHSDNSLHMHRLIQAVLIDRLPTEERSVMRHSAHMLLASSDPNDPNTPRNWPLYNELYPHVMASDAVESEHAWVQRLVENEAKHLYWWGDHESARELARRAYKYRVEHLGVTASSTLSVGRWLAFMLFVTGRYNEAAQLNRELLAAHEVTATEDTEELLDAIGAIAADVRVAGRFKEALNLAESVYQRYVRAFGDEDPETLNAANNLAVSLRLVGDFRRAAEIDEDTATRRRLLLGEDSLPTLLSTQNLILDRRELGDYVYAHREQQTVVERLQVLLDPAHPQTLRATRQLAVSKRKAGDHRGARELSERVSKEFVKRYGEDHPDSITATLDLAIDLRATGMLGPSAELSDQVHGRYERLLGPRHAHTVAAALNRAVAERLRGNVGIARRLNDDGLRVLSEDLGEDHPMVLSCSLNVASDLYAQEEFAAAYERDVDTEQRLTRVWGDTHPTTLACRGNLAMDMVALGRETEAREVHTRTVAEFERLLGRNHPATEAARDLTVRADCDLDPMPL